jgi:N-acetylneuraminate synthase/N,N'-diacetyllegionaminate synthase
MQRPTFIIAEAGVNHNGRVDQALKLIDAAAASGAHAVKFQTFKSELIVNRSAPRARYQKDNMPGRCESQLEMIKRLELSYDTFRALRRYCDQKKIMFLTSTGEWKSTKRILPLVPLLKVGSADLNNIPFLKRIFSTRKPVILSTGMGTLGEIERAVGLWEMTAPFPKTKFPPLTLLHCTTDYPCPYRDVNLNAIKTLRTAFGLPVGLSDHTLGIEVAAAAVALGATIIEKHLTLDRRMEGPDHRASLEPNEFRELVQSIRRVEDALGDSRKKPNRRERAIMRVARKSLVAAGEIPAGTTLQPKMILVKRPGHGIPPEDFDKIVGLTIKKNKKPDELIEWGDFKDE